MSELTRTLRMCSWSSVFYRWANIGQPSAVLTTLCPVMHWGSENIYFLLLILTLSSSFWLLSCRLKRCPVVSTCKLSGSRWHWFLGPSHPCWTTIFLPGQARLGQACFFNRLVLTQKCLVGMSLASEEGLRFSKSEKLSVAGIQAIVLLCCSVRKLGCFWVKIFFNKEYLNLLKFALKATFVTPF